MSNRSNLFLLASFFSALGDTLLLFAIPSGLGSFTGDIRSSVLMWLVPAVAIFISTFFSEGIRKRKHSSRVDYSKLLIFLGVVELLIAVAAQNASSQDGTVILICVFVFIYAMAKEGIPRLFYSVTVYRFFVTDTHYAKIAGRNSALGVLAGLVGTLFAAKLIETGSWKFALVVDAFSFLIFGAIIWIYGTDDHLETEAFKEVSAKTKTSDYPNLLFFTVPLIFGVNALVWNYLPLIANSLSGISVASSTIFIALLRLPGILSGFLIVPISRLIKLQVIAVIIPVLTTIASLIYSIYPQSGAFLTLILLQGILAGLYWPADYTLRSKLNHDALISFNKSIVRSFSTVQFIACLMALYLFKPNHLRIELLPPAIGFIIFMSFLYYLVNIYRFAVPLRIIAALAAILMTVIGFLKFPSTKQEVSVRTFSLSNDMRLNPDLTFAAMTVLNDTSGHLFRINHQLVLEGEIVKSYEADKLNKDFTLKINENYKSGLNIPIEAHDIEYTIKSYLKYLHPVFGYFSQISGADKCTEASCDILGLSVIDKNTIKISLNSPDRRFIEKLASPWLVIFKAGEPLYDYVGDCVLPAQTGLYRVADCQRGEIILESTSDKRRIHLTSNLNAKVDKELTADPVNTSPVPTLTTLSMFANPSSKVDPQLRISLMGNVRARAPSFSRELKLKFAPLYATGWLGIPVPEEFIDVRWKQVTCPKDPIRVLLDSSLPSITKLELFVREAFGCPIEIATTTADKYFDNFRETDFGVAWFTPDFMDISSAFSPFNCSVGQSCYFDWKDKRLQYYLKLASQASDLGERDLISASAVESHLFKLGYVAPISEMNWWIKEEDNYKPIHPAGLFQLRASDFL